MVTNSIPWFPFIGLQSAVHGRHTTHHDLKQCSAIILDVRSPVTGAAAASAQKVGLTLYSTCVQMTMIRTCMHLL
jgi:hypothetical protein